MHDGGENRPTSINLATSFKTPLAIEYHANGFVETGSEIEEVEGSAVVSGGVAEIKIATGKTEEGHSVHLRSLHPRTDASARGRKKT